MGELPSPFALSSAAALSIPSTFPSMAVPASRARESDRKEDDQLVYRLNAEKHCRRSSGRARRGLLPMELQGCRQVRRMPSAQAHDKVPRGAAHQPGAEAGGAQGPECPRGRTGLAAAGSAIPFWRYLPGEPLLLLPQPLFLRSISEHLLLIAMQLRPLQNLQRSWGKVAATPGERDPSASARHPFCLSPHPDPAPTLSPCDEF